MADEETQAEATETAESGGRSPVLLIAGAAVAALLIGAGGAYVAIKPDAERLAELEAQVDQGDGTADASESTSASGDAGESSAPERDVAAGEGGFAERVLTLEPFVVNITGHDYARYLKVKIELEAESPLVRDELEQRLPQVRDGVIVLLSSRRLSDVTDFEGKVLLKEAILERVNGMLETGDVRQVMFTEFVVQ